MPELRRVVCRLKPVEDSLDIAFAPGSGEERGKAKLKIRVKSRLDLNLEINGEEGLKLGRNKEEGLRLGGIKEEGLRLGGIKEEGFDQNTEKMEGRKKLSGEDESCTAPLPQRVQVGNSPVYKVDKKIR